MDIPDAVSTGLITAGALQLAKQGQDFIAAACGHPGESIGTILGTFGKRHLENLNTIGKEAHLIVLNIAGGPKELPLNVVQPLLEAASLEEEPEVQTMWAQLFASATVEDDSYSSYPAFVQTLRQLSKPEAVFFTALHKKVLAEYYEWEKLEKQEQTIESPSDHVGYYEQLRDQFVSTTGRSESEAMIALDNLSRLGLLIRPTIGRAQFMMPIFGVQFGETCAGPKAG